MLALDATIRGWPGAIRWVDAKPDVRWRNQFIFNLVLARLGCGIELDAAYNLQLHCVDAEMSATHGRTRAFWQGREIKVLHFCGTGRHKHPEHRGRYAAVADVLPSAEAGNGMPSFWQHCGVGSGVADSRR